MFDCLHSVLQLKVKNHNKIVQFNLLFFFQTGYDIIKEICGDMDLTSESHYKEYGLFTYIEARKSNQRSKADKNGMKNTRITQLVLQFKVVFGLKFYKQVCTLCFSLFQIVSTVL